MQGGRPASTPPQQPGRSQPAAASPRLPELPRYQVELVSLLVDNPHLASMAEEQGVLGYVTDPRLVPVVREVVQRALVGENPSEGELLELVEPAARRQLHDTVFAGTFRDTQEDPAALLAGYLWDCQREHLKLERRRLDVQAAEAKARGDLDRARELMRTKVEMSRTLAELEQNPPNPGAAAPRA